MKKISLLFLLPILFFSCSSDDNEPKQDYTSFVFEQTVDLDLPNCVVGYLDADKNYIKVAELGTLTLDKPSKEIKVEDQNIKELYFFTDYNHVVRQDAVYTLLSNKKNIFKIASDVKGIPITDKTDPKQYPQ